MLRREITNILKERPLQIHPKEGCRGRNLGPGALFASWFWWIDDDDDDDDEEEEEEEKKKIIITS